MVKYLFVNIPAHGHVNPTLAVVRELVARGAEVTYYLPEAFRSTIEALGATLSPYDSLFGCVSMPVERTGQVAVPARPIMLPLRLAEEAEYVLPQVFERIRSERPDYIVYCASCVWGSIVARALDIPAIMLRPTYAFDEADASDDLLRQFHNVVPAQFLWSANDHLRRLCEQYRVPRFDIKEVFMGSEPLTIVFLPREFQPYGESFGERYQFVGPSVSERPDALSFPIERLINQKVLFVSLGTVFNNQLGFFKQCLDAFADEPWQVVMSIGENVQLADLGPVPDNFYVAPYVPQLEVLQHTSVFLTHCGMNSAMESMYYGVPIVAVPQMPEQAMTARRVHELGLGVALSKDDITLECLQAVVEQVMEDAGYRRRVSEMQRYARTAGGYMKAVDAILEFDRAHHVPALP